MKGYQSVGIPKEIRLSSFYFLRMYTSRCFPSGLHATSVDIPQTILCDLHLRALATGCSGTVSPCMQNEYKLGEDILAL